MQLIVLLSFLSWRESSNTPETARRASLPRVWLACGVQLPIPRDLSQTLLSIFHLPIPNLQWVSMSQFELVSFDLSHCYYLLRFRAFRFIHHARKIADVPVNVDSSYFCFFNFFSNHCLPSFFLASCRWISSTVILSSCTTLQSI